MAEEIVGADFDGFIMPDGELVSIKDYDRMFAVVINRNENLGRITEFLMGLAGECYRLGYFRAAYGYYEKILDLTDEPAARADCLSRMAVAMENSGDYELALDAYLRAFDLPHKSKEISYFLHNNIGFCLNQLGRYGEAAKYCRIAIEIDPGRHNAHKNLGVSLQNQGRYVEAAKSYIRAVQICPEDRRALVHLEELIAGHREELLREMPDILKSLHECHEAVSAANRP